MDPFRTKRPVYILLAVCLVLTAVSLSLIYWVSNNLQAATRLSATGLASDGAGYSLMADEAGETYVLGDYTTRVGFDGITLMSARGDERAHYETDMLDPYVLQDNDTLVVGSAEGSDVFVLNQDGSYFRPAITGAVSSAVCQDGRLLVRWDNSPHWKDMKTFPNHKHLGTAVTPSPRADVPDVIATIREHVNK